jgi:hypothetical protein
LSPLIELIQLLQKDRGIEFAIVAVAETLYSLVNGVLILVVEQVRDFACESIVLMAISIVSDSLAEMT